MEHLSPSTLSALGNINIAMNFKKIMITLDKEAQLKRGETLKDVWKVFLLPFLEEPCALCRRITIIGRKQFVGLNENDRYVGLCCHHRCFECEGLWPHTKMKRCIVADEKSRKVNHMTRRMLYHMNRKYKKEGHTETGWWLCGVCLVFNKKFRHLDILHQGDLQVWFK